jgi:hypothetical protein
MRAGLGQEIGEASDPRAFADDVEKVTVIAGCGIGVMWNST